MSGFSDLFQFEAQMAQARGSLVQTQLPEIMLFEGILLGALGAGIAMFLLIAYFKRSPQAVIAASLAGMAFLIEAASFERLGFLPPGSDLILLALFLSAAMLFITASVRAAKENAIIGALLLLAIIAAVTFGILGVFGIYDAGMPLRFIAGGLAIFSVLFCVQQALSGDARAALIAPGVLIAAGSLVAFIMAGRNGVEGWIGLAIPHAMFSGGLLLAGLASLVPAGRGARRDDKVASEPVAPMAAPMTAMAAGDEATERKASGKDTLNRKILQKKGRQSAAAPARRRAEPPVVADDPEEEPGLPEGITDMSADEEGAVPRVAAPPPAADNKADRRPAAPSQPQSPISSLWGHKSEAARAPVKVRPVAADLSALRSDLGAAGLAYWDWKAPSQVNASEETTHLFGVSKISALTPEKLRGLVADESLAAYDDEILGGGDPATGRFDFPVALRNGRTIRLKGERRVDEDGLMERIIAFVSPEHGAASKATRAAPRAYARPAAPAREDEIEAIRMGLENGEFEAWFQPVIRLADEEIAGFEALARWRRPGYREPVLPQDFMPLAIEAGLELDLAAQILDQAARELADWIGSSPDDGQFVSFNISAVSMIDEHLVRLVRDAIRRYRLPAGTLMVELTESHVLQDQAQALSIAKSLRQAGARIALDDLGTGASSLSQLSKFRFDMIKTDRSLLASAERDDHGHTLLAGLMDMAHRMGTLVIAEGVETQRAAQMLEAMGCDYGQGFYYGRPEPADGGGDNGAESGAVMAALR